VRELGLDTAEDREVWRTAREQGAVVISKDEDFSIIADGPDAVQVVWLRLGNCSNERLMARIAELWPIVIKELEDGSTLIEIR
jgi:predicted nuclease of predicted toxin-antitoxin system